jgi:hypothetical protein
VTKRPDITVLVSRGDDGRDVEEPADATFDNETFYQLTGDAAADDVQVTVVAGGQPGEYPSRHVLPADAAIAAAIAWARSGALAEGLSWETR